VILLLAGKGESSLAAAASNHIDAPVLTSTKQIHALSAEQAKLGYPVRIEGVATYYDPEQHFFFVQDSSGGVFAIAREEQDPRRSL